MHTNISAGTVFWQTSIDTYKMSIFFLLTAATTLGGFAGLEFLFPKRAVYYKQRDSNMYPTTVYAAAEVRPFWAFSVCI